MSRTPLGSTGQLGSKSDNQVSDLCHEVNHLRKDWSSFAIVSGHDEAMRALIDHVRKIGRVDGSGEVFAMERAFLQHERDYEVRTPKQKKSVENALVQLVGAESALSELQDDPEAYRNYATKHAIPPKNRIGELPRDSARDYFRSQRARLTNLRKSPHDDLTHKLYEVRREALRSAEKTYIELQRETLGLPAVEKERS